MTTRKIDHPGVKAPRARHPAHEAPPPRPSPPRDGFDRRKTPRDGFDRRKTSRLAGATAPTPIVTDIDERIRGRISVNQRTHGAAGSMDVRTVRYQDDQNDESMGNHNVYVRILGPSGREIPPADVARYFDVRYNPGTGETLTANPKLNDASGVANDAWTTSRNSGGPSAAYFDVPLWKGNETQVWLAPKAVPDNPYAGFGSQQTGPFTMPGAHHVNYLVTFQARPGATGGAAPSAPALPPSQPGAVAPEAAAPDVSAASARISVVASRRSLGAPVDNGGGVGAHDWDGLTVQDFAGGADTEGRSMVVDSTAGGTHLVRNDFYKNYLEGKNHVALGGPVEDEHWENGKVLQRFERGEMTWTPGQGTTVTVNGAAPAGPAQPPGHASLGDVVEGVYQSELGRASDPGGKASWVGFAEGLRAKGKTDDEIGSTLVAMFRQSDEYRAKGSRPPVSTTPVDSIKPAGPGSPGSVYAPYEVAPGVKVNGRLGVHWINTVHDGDMGRAQKLIDKMKTMGVGYTTLLVDPRNPGAQANLIKKLQENGITPTARLYIGTPPDEWSAEDIAVMASGAKALDAMGVKLVQVGNEPNLEGNLLKRGVSREVYLAASVEKQAQALLAVRNAVGDSVKIGIPPMGSGSPDSDATGTHAPQTYFPAMLQAIHRLELQSGKRLCDWIPTHTYTMGQPGTDGPSQMGATSRGQLGWGPATSAWYEQQVRQVLGYSAKSLSTEGGAEPNAFRNNPDLTRGQMQEAMDALRGNKNLTNCLWLLFDDEGMRNGEWGKWDKIALLDGEGAWAGGLSKYRDDYGQR